MEITLTNANFEKEVLQSDVPVLVDFWAAWCGPCRMVAPLVAEIAEEYADQLKVGKVNVDEESELADRYRISSIPALMLFKDGKLSNTLVGYHPKEDLEEFIKG